jgi:hypothetical protein
MANRIAELNAESRRAAGAAEKAEIDGAIEKLILDLWLHRAALPGNVDPNKRLSKALDILEKLEPKRSFFAQAPYEGAQLEHEAVSAYQFVENLVVQLTLLKLAEDLANPDEAELPLSVEEVDFRRKIQNLMDHHVRGSSIYIKRDRKEETQSDAEILREKIDAGALKAMEALASVRRLLASGAEQQESRKAKASKLRHHPSRKKV